MTTSKKTTLYGVMVIDSAGGWFITGSIYESEALAIEWAQERWGNSPNRIEIIKVVPHRVVKDFAK